MLFESNAYHLFISLSPKETSLFIDDHWMNKNLIFMTLVIVTKHNIHIRMMEVFTILCVNKWWTKNIDFFCMCYLFFVFSVYNSNCILMTGAFFFSLIGNSGERKQKNYACTLWLCIPTECDSIRDCDHHHWSLILLHLIYTCIFRDLVESMYSWLIQLGVFCLFASGAMIITALIS